MHSFLVLKKNKKKLDAKRLEDGRKIGIELQLVQ